MKFIRGNFKCSNRAFVSKQKANKSHVDCQLQNHPWIGSGKWAHSPPVYSLQWHNKTSCKWANHLQIARCIQSESCDTNRKKQQIQWRKKKVRQFRNSHHFDGFQCGVELLSKQHEIEIKITREMRNGEVNCVRCGNRVLSIFLFKF